MLLYPCKQRGYKNEVGIIELDLSVCFKMDFAAKQDTNAIEKGDNFN